MYAPSAARTGDKTHDARDVAMYAPSAARTKHQLIYPLSTVVMELAPLPVLLPGTDLASVIASLRKFELSSGSLDKVPQDRLDALDAEFNCEIFSLGDTPPENFDHGRIRAATARIRAHGLFTAVESFGQEYFESKGRGSLDDLRTAFAGVETAAKDRLLALHAGGRSLRMRPGWVPNGADTSVRSAQLTHRNHTVIQHHLAKLVNKGKAIAVELSDLSPSDRALVNINSTLLARKNGDTSGRFCLNLKKGHGGAPAFNDAMDSSMSLEYPRFSPIGSPEIAEMACRAREAYPGEVLYGGTMDSSQAFNQVSADAPYCLSTATRLGTLVIIPLTNQWADKYGGDAYGVYSEAFNQQHNVDRMRSVTYVDDTVLVNPLRILLRDMGDFSRLLDTAFGPGGENKDKRYVFKHRLVALGNEYDLHPDVWRVAPKELNRRKLVWAVTVLAPPQVRLMQSHDLEILIGLLMHHSQVLRPGASFMYCLYDCLHNPRSRDGDPEGSVRLSDGAMDDLDFWRQMVAITVDNPHYAGVSIDALRLTFRPKLYARGDACTGNGCGIYLSIHGHDGPVVEQLLFRWTRLELELFKRLGTTINCMEFVAALYGLIVWSVRLLGTQYCLRESAIALECDNVTAITYFLKARARSAAPSRVIQLYSTAKLIFGWNDRATFLKGEKNVRADGLSRQKGNTPAAFDGLDSPLPHDDTSKDPYAIAEALQRETYVTSTDASISYINEQVRRLREEGSPEAYSEADLLEDRTYCGASKLEVSCRRLLINCLLTPEFVHWNSLPKRLTDLLGDRT